ncbi:uncharacterized protein NESG_01554 [Nematocida ausubeli]|uniref:Uncharacterized protein n=1 Tax=Nematocida ausubeli (strain ATCC PRA-371 / ERTm2) TaxID=1913371 RepID=A0A086J2R3_NEMA1|nr:uncharacterized protein NESG_01554 [Nematocida ausubeli]KFG26431.1 hypothetical protein NESG_01554 [Nematocida ausubeli]
MGILEKNKKRDMSCAQVWDRKSMIRKAIWTVLLVVAASFGIYVLIYLLVIWRESQKDALKSTQLTLRGDREERIWGHENANNYLDADRTSDNKESAETEESSTSSLDVSEEKEKGCTCGRAADAGAQGVLEGRHLGRSNSTGKLAEYAMDKKNSSNLIVEKKEEGMAKEDVEAAIEKYTVEMERLPEMKNAANLAKDAFEEKSREAEDVNSLKNKEISDIIQEINNRYGDPFNIKPADNTGFDPEISKKIHKHTAEIDAID